MIGFPAVIPGTTAKIADNGKSHLTKSVPSSSWSLRRTACLPPASAPVPSLRSSTRRSGLGEASPAGIRPSSRPHTTARVLLCVGRPRTFSPHSMPSTSCSLPPSAAKYFDYCERNRRSTPSGRCRATVPPLASPSCTVLLRKISPTRGSTFLSTSTNVSDRSGSPPPK